MKLPVLVKEMKQSSYTQSDIQAFAVRTANADFIALAFNAGSGFYEAQELAESANHLRSMAAAWREFRMSCPDLFEPN